MIHTINVNPELSKLQHCFQKIESLADTMGMGIDELLQEEQKKYQSGTFFRRAFDKKSMRRNEILRRNLSVVR